MSVETDEDRDVFFNTDEFGESFTVASTTVSGLFNEEFSDEDGIESSNPSVVVKSSLVSSLPISRNTSITRVSDGIVYKAREFEPDGFGMTRIELEKQ